MIKTNFQPKIGLKQPNALTQRPQPSIWVEKTTQRFLECMLKISRTIFKSRNQPMTLTLEKKIIIFNVHGKNKHIFVHNKVTRKQYKLAGIYSRSCI